MRPEPLGTCIVLIKNHQVLLGKRQNSYKSGWYGLPGGRLELREPLIDCAGRELKEETGVLAKNLTYLGPIRELQDDYNFIHFAFVCNQFQGDPKVMELDKCESWEWCDLDKLPNKILPGHQAAIDMYLTQNSETYRDLITAGL